jgi:tRNA modification GTPase
VLQVWNKTDRASSALQTRVRAEDPQALLISAKTGEGLKALRQALLRSAGWQPAEGIYMARQRHLLALQAVAEHLVHAAAQLQSVEPALDLLAEDLRQSQNALGQITGEFTSDDLLGEIFSRFCIGK